MAHKLIDRPTKLVVYRAASSRIESSFNLDTGTDIIRIKMSSVSVKKNCAVIRKEDFSDLSDASDSVTGRNVSKKTSMKKGLAIQWQMRLMR